MLKEIILKCLNLNNWLKKNQNCLLCEDEARHFRGWIFCSSCLGYLPWLTQTCVQCGINLSDDLSGAKKKCASCLMRPPFFDQTVGIFAYEHPISKMLIQYKYHGQLFYVPTFSDMLALKILANYKQNLRKLPDIILPVPLSTTRLKIRGFNQASELAKYLSKILGVPYHAHVLKRSRDTPKQVGLSLKQRQANLKNAFDFVDVNKIRLFVKNKHIALVDDVFTTGATSEALARKLKEAGASSVDIWVLARTLARIS